MTDLESLRRDPELLSNYLLGAPHHAEPGLISRVQRRLLEAGTVNDIGARSRSVLIGSRGGRPNDLGDRILDLAVALIEWRSGGIGRATAAARRDLVATLARWRISDLEYVFGQHPEGTDLIHMVRQEVAAGLSRPTPRSVRRAGELASFLTDWLAPCEHDWLEAYGVDGSVTRRCSRCEAGWRVDPQGALITL